MGCDIHMAVEVFKDDKWTWIKDAVPCLDCDGTLKNVYRGEESRCFCTHGYYGSPGREHGYRHRNYDVFGVLANVRNGTWGRETPYICEPRGLPPFMDEALVAANQDEDDDARFCLGDHGLTFLTLAELVAFDWTQPIHREALVSWQQFENWNRVSPPESYCAGAGGSVVTQEQAEELLARGEKANYVRARWKETLAEASGTFCAKFIPRLKELATAHGVGPTAVRIVFGFDN